MAEQIVTMVRVWTLLYRGDIDEYFWLEGGTGNGQVGAWLVFDIVT